MLYQKNFNKYIKLKHKDIEVGDETFAIVLENHVCGVIYNK